MPSEDRIVLYYFALLKHLSTNAKLKLIEGLSESIRDEHEDKPEDNKDAWKSLFGAWADMPDNIVDEIRNNRLPKRDVSSFEA